MATTPEGKVKQACKKILNELGAYHFFPATGGYGRSGVADIVGCYKGLFFAIECKAGKGRLTALQAAELDRVEGAGGLALMVNEEGVKTLKQHLIYHALQQLPDDDIN